MSTITRGGQISIPADVRRRWNTSRVRLTDLGDRVVVEPAPDDPVSALRGALASGAKPSSAELRRAARAEQGQADSRRSGGGRT